VFLQEVEFAVQARAVAARSLRAEDGSVPKVGPHVTVGLAAEQEPSVFDGYELRLRGARCRSQCGEKQNENLFHRICRSLAGRAGSVVSADPGRQRTAG